MVAKLLKNRKINLYQMSFLDKFLSGKKQEVDPKDILGSYLVGLIETALSDGVLTRKEKETLLAIAMDEGVDLNIFTQFLTSETESRGIVFGEDNANEDYIIDLQAVREFNSLIAKKIEVATADGSLSTKEKIEILSEANKLGLNVEHLEKLLENVIKKKEPTPTEKFGPMLVQMAEMAFSDGQLTDSELDILKNMAIDNGIDCSEYLKYIEDEAEKRKVRIVKDNKPKVKIENKDNIKGNNKFRSLIELAIADGEVSSEERAILIKEGKLLGFSEEDVDKIIEILLSPQLPPAPKLPVVNPNDLKHLKRLIKVQNLPDGTVEEYWEHIDEELVPNTKPDAKPGAMLLIKKKYVIRKRFKRGAQSSGQQSSSVIEFLSSIDYEPIEKVVNTVSIFYAPVSVLNPVVSVLKSASISYRKANPENRDRVFLMAIGNVSMVAALPLFKKYVKNGDQIADGLGLLLSNNPLK